MIMWLTVLGVCFLVSIAQPSYIAQPNLMQSRVDDPMVECFLDFLNTIQG